MNFTQEEKQAANGTLRLELKRNGVVFQVITEKNLVVNGGKSALARLLGGDVTGRSIDRVAVGTNGTAAALTDTAITGAVTVAATATYPTATSVRFSFTVPTGTANGMNLREFGLLTAGGALFARRVTGLIEKTSDLEINGTWTINF